MIPHNRRKHLLRKNDLKIKVKVNPAIHSLKNREIKSSKI